MKHNNALLCLTVGAVAEMLEKRDADISERGQIMMLFYARDRSLSVQRTAGVWATALTIFALVGLSVGWGWAILTGALWFIKQLFSFNRMDRAFALGTICVALVVFIATR